MNEKPESERYLNEAARLAAQMLNTDIEERTKAFNAENHPKRVRRISKRRLAVIALAAALLLGLAALGADALRPKKLKFNFNPSAPNTVFVVEEE